MEFKETLEFIKDMCGKDYCVNCPLYTGRSGCQFERDGGTPRAWIVDAIEKGVSVMIKKEHSTPADEKQPCDMVNHPAHYTQGGIECIDAIKAAVTGITGMEAVCTGNIIRYIWRWKFKNGLEDLKKCRWYIDKLIEEVEGAKG